MCLPGKGFFHIGFFGFHIVTVETVIVKGCSLVLMPYLLAHLVDIQATIQQRGNIRFPYLMPTLGIDVDMITVLSDSCINRPGADSLSSMYE